MHKKITIPGRRSKVALLFIHGFACKCEQVRPFHEYFKSKAGIDVFSPNLKGHTENTINLKGIKKEDWKEQVLEWYKTLEKEYDKIVVAGYSMGAILAMNLVANNKCPKVTKMVFLAPAVKHIWPTNLLRYTDKIILNGIPNLYKTRTIGKLKSRKVTIGSMRQLRALDIETRKSMDKINVPVSIHHMKGDCYVKYTSSKYLAKQLKKVPFIDLNLHSGGTHLIMHEKISDKIFNDIYNFIILDLDDLNKYHYTR